MNGESETGEWRDKRRDFLRWNSFKKMDKKDDGAKSGNVAQSGCTGSVTGNMVAPGTGGAVQIPRDAFEANTKAYFDNLHNKDNATK
ncbi:hypothetical protein HID58_040421 [Brassica napus]|uniref:Uncharacterized protein n=2 Tax=Brassica napus TaxID=3708 RepID=A0ABQ8B876_BRANA|nr:hypothetical protein HID58_040421 [Brassica napus]